MRKSKKTINRNIIIFLMLLFIFLCFLYNRFYNKAVLVSKNKLIKNNLDNDFKNKFLHKNIDNKKEISLSTREKINFQKQVLKNEKECSSDYSDMSDDEFWGVVEKTFKNLKQD